MGLFNTGIDTQFVNMINMGGFAQRKQNWVVDPGGEFTITGRGWLILVLYIYISYILIFLFYTYAYIHAVLHRDWYGWGLPSASPQIPNNLPGKTGCKDRYCQLEWHAPCHVQIENMIPSCTLMHQIQHRLDRNPGTMTLMHPFERFLGFLEGNLILSKSQQLTNVGQVMTTNSGSIKISLGMFLFIWRYKSENDHQTAPYGNLWSPRKERQPMALATAPGQGYGLFFARRGG